MALTVATVDTAIEAIQGGAQSWSVDGMSYTMANIDVLIGLRARLHNELGRSAGTRPMFRGFKFGSMGYSDSATGTTPTPVICNQA